MQISLNVYDVTNTANDNTNGMITRLNSITRELNFGGVFHGAVQVDELEWSFGYCESGSGVYCCRARSNSLYTFREHVELGVTRKTKQEVSEGPASRIPCTVVRKYRKADAGLGVRRTGRRCRIREILTRFKRAWPGTSYDLLQRNCCHFCEELCVVLEVPSPPAWLNRFAQGADATVKFTNEASALAKRVSTNISFTAQQSAVWLRDLSQRVLSQISESPSTDGGTAGPSDDSPGGDHSTVAVSPLYARSVSSSSSSDPGARREGSGMARLTSRLRQFGGPASGSGPGGGGGLPSSTPSSSCDLPSRQDASATAASQQQQQQPLTMTLRQKWQELEASAGDGTKQFLFGLIKTRQTRFDEDDPSLGGGEFERAGSSVSPGSPGRAVRQEPQSNQTAAAAAATAAAAGLQAGYSEPTQAPALQVISHSLLPPDVVGGPPPAAAVAVSPQAVVPQAAPDTEDPGLGLGAEVASPASEPATGAAVASSVADSQHGRSTPPNQHLLDM